MSTSKYSTIANPAKALAALESEMFNNSNSEDGCSKLRTMLEEEIEAVSKQTDQNQADDVRVSKPFSKVFGFMNRSSNLAAIAFCSFYPV